MKISSSSLALLSVAVLINSAWSNQTWAEEKNVTSENVPEKTAVDILDTARLQENLSTFVTAIEAGGLEETLKGDGPLTVFAPTNAAFNALPKGAVKALLDPAAKEQLSMILKYHVVYGEENSENFDTKKTTLNTIGGKTIEVDGVNGLKVNIAKLVTRDIKSKNGVIHIIDAVLIPPAN